MKKIVISVIIIFCFGIISYIFFGNKKKGGQKISKRVDRTIELASGSYYFQPNNIEVKQGKTIEFVVSNFGYHTFVIDELNIKKELPYENSKFTITFDKKGAYVFYCDVAGHRQKGQEGKIVVN